MIYESLGTETVYNPADASEPTSTEDYVVQRQALEDGILLITQYEETIDKNVVSNVMGSAVHSMDEHFNPSAALEFTIGGLRKKQSIQVARILDLALLLLRQQVQKLEIPLPLLLAID